VVVDQAVSHQQDAMARSGRPTGVVLLTGGYGGARLSPHLAAALAPSALTVVANVGDDLSLWGLRICPDVDSNLYALGGVWDDDRGWGRRSESFNVQGALGELGAATWFGLGDRDLALHLLRGELLRQGSTLTDAAAACAAALGIRKTRVVPAADEPSETRILTSDARELTFQEWHVRERGLPAVASVRLAGGPPSPALVEVLQSARAVIVGPSNPVSSIAPILALDGVRDLVASVPVRVAVSPIVLGAPPAHAAARHRAELRQALLRTRQLDDTPTSIATIYRQLVDTFVVDERDAGHRGAIEAIGLKVELTDLLDGPALAVRLAELTGMVGRGAS
jgi:LPPG:FO 2-phospho-L-lactate transferase